MFKAGLEIDNSINLSQNGKSFGADPERKQINRMSPTKKTKQNVADSTVKKSQNPAGTWSGESLTPAKPMKSPIKKSATSVLDKNKSGLEL